MKEILLKTKQKTLVDNQDYELLSKFKWGFHSKGYVRRGSGKGIVILMHRQILNAKKGEEVDHKNGNKLDNRRINLRLCSRSQNRANISKFKKTDSKKEFKGTVYKSDGKRIKRWIAQITIGRKTIRTKAYLVERDAAKKYNEMANKYFGEFAKLNKLAN